MRIWSRRLAPVGAILLAALLPFWRVIFMGQAIGPWDQIRTFLPGNAGAQVSAPWDVLQADGVLQFAVWRKLVFQAWGSGHAPIWNPYQLSGSPLLANSQSGALYPPHVVFGGLHFGFAVAMFFLAWLHLAWAGIGVFWLSRLLGGTKVGAAAAGIAFALSPFMVSWTGLPSVIETVSWIPWVLAFGYVLLTRPFSRVLVPYWFGLAASLTMMVLAGHLQFFVYGIIALAVLTLVELIRKGGTPSSKLVSLGAMVAAGALGMALAWPQLGPVLALGRQSPRQTTPSFDNYQGYIKGGLDYRLLPATIDSEILGLPNASLSDSTPSVAGYWPALIFRGENFAESSLGMQPFAFLVLVSCVTVASLKRASAVVAIGIGGFLLAYGTWANLIPYFLIPGWSATGSPGRAGCLFVLACCVLVGVSLDPKALKNRAILKRIVVPVALFVALASVCFQLSLGASWLGETNADAISSQLKQVFQTGLLEALGLFALTSVCLYLKLPKLKFSWRIGAALIASNAFLAFQILPTGKPLDTDFPINVDQSDRVAIVNGDWNLISRPQALVPSNLLAYFDIHEVGGYDSLVRSEAKDRLGAIDGVDPSPQANGNMIWVKPGFDPTKLAEAGVNQVWSLNTLPQQVDPSTAEGISISHIASASRASTPNGPAALVEESADDETFQAAGPGRLTVRDDLTEGWACQVDGVKTDLKRADWPYVELGPGPHTVKLLAPKTFFVKLMVIEWPVVYAFCFVFALFVVKLGSRQKLSSAEPVLSNGE